MKGGSSLDWLSDNLKDEQPKKYSNTFYYPNEKYIQLQLKLLWIKKYLQ